MEWKNSEIIKLIQNADFSEETNLKADLLKEIQSQPVGHLSFHDLEKQVGRKSALPSNRQPSPVKQRSNIREAQEMNGVLNNDRPMLPGRSTGLKAASEYSFQEYLICMLK